MTTKQQSGKQTTELVCFWQLHLYELVKGHLEGQGHNGHTGYCVQCKSFAAVD